MIIVLIIIRDQDTDYQSQYKLFNKTIITVLWEKQLNIYSDSWI